MLHQAWLYWDIGGLFVLCICIYETLNFVNALPCLGLLMCSGGYYYSSISIYYNVALFGRDCLEPSCLYKCTTLNACVSCFIYYFCLYTQCGKQEGFLNIVPKWSIDLKWDIIMHPYFNTSILLHSKWKWNWFPLVWLVINILLDFNKFFLWYTLMFCVEFLE